MESSLTELGWLTVPLAVLSGAIRVGTPFLFVSLGECLTERSGRINISLEGTLVMGAMTGYGTAYLTGSPWLGVLAAACAGALLGGMHSLLCSRPGVDHIAAGIALMLFATGIAFFFGKPLIQPRAPQLPDLPLGFWSDLNVVQANLRINPLFVIGVLVAPVMWWAFNNTRWGLYLRTVGDSAEAARALGLGVNGTRAMATMIGGFFAGIGGAFLSLSYPGIWNEGLSSGQGLMAVVLVIFARWHPVRCLWAALLFGGASALAPALQSVGISSGYHLITAAPYLLTLILMIVTSSPERSLRGAPAELALNRTD
ncbi:MAG: ABC transporter permease [Rhodospirillaceae bacterium]|nr:ABC transporter permease [Rhodospirillaceae bacterium]